MSAPETWRQMSVRDLSGAQLGVEVAIRVGTNEVKGHLTNVCHSQIRPGVLHDIEIRDETGMRWRLSDVTGELAVRTD